MVRKRTPRKSRKKAPASSPLSTHPSPAEGAWRSDYPIPFTPNDELAIAAGYVWDRAKAERARTFFKTCLVHTKGQWAGQPFDPLDWQWRYIIAPLFGWVHKDTGYRRFRIAYISVPKKNGKSTICSGLALLLTIGDNEPGAEVYGAACDKQQAGIVFDEAMAMANHDRSVLKKHVVIIPSRKRIYYQSTNSWYQAMSADVGSKEGLKIHGLIFDELHAQRNRTMWDTYRYGGETRRQPLIIAITTAGWDRNSICYEQYDYARKVQAGAIADLNFYSYIAEASPDDDWTSPEVWRRANPSMGILLDEDSMAAACLEAKSSPAKLNAFLRYRLNIWTEQAERSIHMDEWDACSGIVDPAELEGMECHGGLDLSSTRDLTAFVLVFKVDDKIKVLPFFWVPRDTAVERDREGSTPYLSWIQAGLIETTPGKVTDYDAIRKRINELGTIYNIRRVPVDRWNATQLQVQLNGDGFDCMPFGQGFASMSAPTKELERLIACRGLEHGGNPVLRWMASNLCITEDPAGNKKPDKAKSGEKIDGIVGLIMGLGSLNLQEAGGSVYDERGVETI